MDDRLGFFALSRFKDAFVKAVDFIDLKGVELEDKLFPLWRDAVHDIVKETQICPCAKINTGSCFLTWTPDKQRTYFPDGHSLGYATFKRTFSTGRSFALSVLAQKPLEGIH